MSSERYGGRGCLLPVHHIRQLLIIHLELVPTVFQRSDAVVLLLDDFSLAVQGRIKGHDVFPEPFQQTGQPDIKALFVAIFQLLQTGCYPPRHLFIVVPCQLFGVKSIGLTQPAKGIFFSQIRVVLGIQGWLLIGQDDVRQCLSGFLGKRALEVVTVSARSCLSCCDRLFQ